MIPVPIGTLNSGRLVRTVDNRAPGPLQTYLREFATGIVSEFRLEPWPDSGCFDLR